MESRWDDEEAARFPGDLGQRVYSSRLLGDESSLVLHGGGNTSVKLRQRSLLGTYEDVLYVKGSGYDLKSIDADGFTALRLEPLVALARVEELSHADMAREIRVATLDPDMAAPSVETLLHAVLPHRYVDHTHADAVLALTNTPSGEEHVDRAYGERVIAVPYVRPGFGLARLCAQAIETRLSDSTIGLVLLNHGLVSFGQTAHESYERMIELVTCAEEYLSARGAGELAISMQEGAEGHIGLELAQLRAQISAIAGFPLLLRHESDPQALSFARHPNIETLSQSGPVTPDHVIWTRRVPLIGRDVDAYAAAYRHYFDAHAADHETGPLEMLDAAPRVVLDPELGLCTAGRTAAEADAIAEIYKHTLQVILQATALERWKALSAADVFAVEYWAPEQAKLWRNDSGGEFTGEVVMVTGAASGIGRACIETFLARGASVCGIDINPVVAEARAPSFLSVVCDVTREEQIAAALESCVRRFGGLDILVLSAGVFPPSQRLDTLDVAEWRRVFAVNADAALSLMRLAYPFLELAPRGGRVIVIASKNVAAPGPGAAAYSASKAALTQLARLAALEWGAAGIRVNVVHPHAVFDTGMWSDEIIRARAAQYGLAAEDYRTRNILGVKVVSRDVAELVTAMCGPAFAKTTGAQVPIDGGNERVI